MNLDERLLKQVREIRLALGLTILVGMVGGVLVVFQARYLSLVIGEVFLKGISLDQSAGALTVLLVVIVLRSLAAWGSELSGGAAAVRIKSSLRERLFEKIISSGPEYVSREQSGELTGTLVDGVEALDSYFGQYLPQLCLAALVPIILLVFVFQVDLLSGIILLVTAPLIPLFMVLIGNQAQKETRRQWRVLSQMNAYFMDVLAGLKTLKTMGRSRDQTREIGDVSERYRSITMRVLRITFLSALVLEMVATLSTAVIAVEIGLRLLYGRLGFEQALFILILAPEFYLPLRLLGSRFHAGMTGVSAARRIFDILEHPETPQTPLETAGRIQAAATETGHQDLNAGKKESTDLFWETLQLDDVHFSYSGRARVLDGVRFTITKGERVALVGPSGAGKITIASLLLRFADPEKGVLRIDGAELAAFDPRLWRTNIAWISQTPYLFHGTIAENIRAARPRAGMEEVIHAARLALADGFIEKLPDQYSTLIGEWGAGLSAGQAQRIALARAFLVDAPFLILDEPTASLDPDTEADLQTGMDRLLEGRTALIIAHRLHTTTRADLVIVLDKGRVVQQGTHAELAARQGLYRRMIAENVPETGYQIPRKNNGEPALDEIESGVSQITGELLSTTMTDIVPVRRLGIPSAASFSGMGVRHHRPPPLDVLKRLAGLLSPFKSKVLLSVLAGYATVASGIGLLATSAYLISAAALQPSIADLQVAIVGVRAFGISRGLFRYLERYLSHQVTFRLLAGLRVWFYRSLEPLAPARIMSYQSGDLLRRINNDIESLQNLYVRALAPPLVGVLITLSMCMFLYQFDPAIMLVLLLFMILLGAGVPALVYLLSREPGREYVSLYARLNMLIIESIHGVAELIVFRQEVRQIDRLKELNLQIGHVRMKMANIAGVQAGLIVLISNLCMWAILVTAVPLVNSGQIPGVALAVVVLAALASFEAVQPISQAAQYLESNLAAAERLYEIIDAEPAVCDPVDPEPAAETFDLDFLEVSFQYPAPEPSPYGSVRQVPGSIRQAVSEISVGLAAQRKIAVVGTSGAGKSTLINLLLRFWEFNSGSLLISGHNIRDIDSYEFRGKTAALEQDGYLFNASVRENLLIGCPDATDEQLVEAAKTARIDELINSLPEGYSTRVGERGFQLSGGEKQRLLLARTLLRESSLLLLDEPTANLDAITEGELLDSLKAVWENRSVLFITHRLVGLEDMDEILVMDGGLIVERGTHSALMQRGGFYQRLWTLQHQNLIESLQGMESS